MKTESKLTDSQIIKLDEEIRKSKIGRRYEPTPPDDVVRCLNSIDNHLNMLLIEIRRMCDVLSCLSDEKEK